MITRRQVLAAAAPSLWVVAGQAGVLTAGAVGWYLWDRRAALGERIRSAVRM